jgi:hypothetical protein
LTSLDKFRVPRWVDKAFLLVGLALLTFVITRLPLSDVLHACVRVGPIIALLPIVALGWFFTNACGLYTLLDGRVSRGVLLWNRLVGDGYNALLPLGGFGGEPFKLRHLSELIPPAQALTGMLRDRLTENAVGFSFSATWILLGVCRLSLGGALRVALLTYAAVATAIAFFYVLVLTTRLPGRLGAAAMRRFGVESTAVERLPLSRLAIAALWYLVGRGLGMIEVLLLFAALGLPLNPYLIGFAYSFLQAAGFIGFFIPQGLGVFEGASAWLFALLGFPGALGVAFVFARRGRLLLVALLGVVAHVLTRASADGERAVP